MLAMPAITRRVGYFPGRALRLGSLSLAIFNLLPFLPLDGGQHVVRCRDE